MIARFFRIRRTRGTRASSPRRFCWRLGRGYRPHREAARAQVADRRVGVGPSGEDAAAGNRRGPGRDVRRRQPVCRRQAGGASRRRAASAPHRTRRIRERRLGSLRAAWPARLDHQPARHLRSALVHRRGASLSARPRRGARRLLLLADLWGSSPRCSFRSWSTRCWSIAACRRSTC